MYINKKFLTGLFILLLSHLAYAEMTTTEINGYAVNYYVPDISIAQVPDNMQMSLIVLIEDPSPLPDNYLSPKINSVLIPDTVNRITTTTFSIDYIDAGESDIYGEACSDFPEEAKVDFNAAATIWANSINTNVPITIQACWSNFGSSSTLGYSGGYSTANFTNAPISNTYYKLSLANSFAGTDIHSSYYNMYITYNGAYDWYYGVDGQTPNDKMDLLTVVLHEIAHGLNFSGNIAYGSSRCSSENYGCYNTYPGVYDRFVIDGLGDPLLDIANDSSAMGDAITSGDLYFNGTHAKTANGGDPVKIYTPSLWSSGSSYSHLDYATFNNTSNELMVYAVSLGEATHAPGDITLGMFEDMGWDMASNNPTTSDINPAVIMYLLN